MFDLTKMLIRIGFNSDDRAPRERRGGSPRGWIQKAKMTAPSTFVCNITNQPRGLPTRGSSGNTFYDAYQKPPMHTDAHRY
jgi:hypothetical protein